MDALEVSGYVDTRRAAAHAQVHVETIRRWIREGLLPAQKLGQVWFIAPDVVQALLDHASTSGTARERD